MNETEYLLQIYRDFKIMFANEDYEGARKYIKSRIKSDDNHILRTMLVATKSFKMNYILKPTIDELVSVLEKRIGKKLN